jgi:Fe-S oxidoreductase
MSSIHIPTLAELTAAGQTPDVLFWVGCAGSFDDRAKRITKAIARILNASETSFAVLGTRREPAREIPPSAQATSFCTKCKPLKTSRP